MGWGDLGWSGVEGSGEERRGGCLGGSDVWWGGKVISA